MNTITTTASTNVILAIDLGKYKSVACVHDPATGEYCFTTFETTRAELRKLIGKPAVETRAATGSRNEQFLPFGFEIYFRFENAILPIDVLPLVGAV